VGNTLLYLVRHGEAEGAYDPGLTPTGRQQAMLAGKRLWDVPFDAIHHSPLRRAAETAQLISRLIPGVPIAASDLLGDCVPSVPEREVLSPRLAAFMDSVPPHERTEGPRQVAAALKRFTSVGGRDRRELVVTHNFVIGWFVRDALDAPSWRWMGLNQHNCGLTVLRYTPDGTRTLLAFNDTGHLPPELRGTGFPPELRF
jgi:broad specificity phosphatase PhoE